MNFINQKQTVYGMPVFKSLTAIHLVTILRFILTFLTFFSEHITINKISNFILRLLAYEVLKIHFPFGIEFFFSILKKKYRKIFLTIYFRVLVLFAGAEINRKCLNAKEKFKSMG